jgi:hypothetical protein
LKPLGRANPFSKEALLQVHSLIFCIFKGRTVATL